MDLKTLIDFKGLWAGHKTKIIVAVLFIVGMVAAYAGGRFAAPTKVVEKTVTVEKKVEVEKQIEVVKWKDRVVVQWKTQQAIVADQNTDCTEDFSPTTGMLLKRHCLTLAHTDTHTNNEGNSDTTHEGESTKTDDHTTTTETTKTTIKETERGLPDWSLSAHALINTKDLMLSFNHIDWGVTVQRRIIWTIYGGFTAVPQAGMYGLTLTLQK